MIRHSDGRIDWVKLGSVIIISLIFIMQGFFLYLSTAKETGRNLMIIEKPPARVIMRWDNTPYEIGEENIEIEKLLVQERINLVNGILNQEFKEYKFNDTLNVNIHTEVIKSDNSNVIINEKEDINNKGGD